MQLSPLYLEQLDAARQKGIQQGLQQVRQQEIQQGERRVIENLLKVRFGDLDEELQAIIEPLLQLSVEEYSPLLLQSAREELLERFRS